MGDPWTKHVKIGACDLYLGDCLSIMPALGKVDAVVTDPPYGMNWTGKVSVGRNGNGKKGAKAKHYGDKIINDDKPFDPSPFLEFDDVILFGFTHFASQLPVGTNLVWIKRLDAGFGSFLSDAEIAWKKGGHGVYCKRDTSLMAETKHRAHPTQKPLGIMEWCLGFLPDAETILDPFMGSGTTLVACAKLGRKGIGIEMDPDYFEIACKRVQAAYDQPDLFVAPNAPPTQEGMDL
jgi:site-specific DNA-methyltransferase (adenine-specific)